MARLVVVERVIGATTGDLARVGFESETDLTGHELLAGVHEGVQGLLEGREPQAVVDQLGVAGFEAGLLTLEITFQTDRLEVTVSHDQCQGCRALVGLAALDPDPAVLDHVDTAPAIGTDLSVEAVDYRGQRQPFTVD